MMDLLTLTLKMLITLWLASYLLSSFFLFIGVTRAGFQDLSDLDDIITPTYTLIQSHSTTIKLTESIK